MVETDLKDYFRELCKQSEWSLQKIQDAGQSNANRPQTDAAATKPTGTQVSDDRKRRHTTDHEASDRWQELREQWRSHVAKLKADSGKKLVELDATGAAYFARDAESDAQHAIAHALEAIEEAERSVICALNARASAERLASEGASQQ